MKYPIFLVIIYLIFKSILITLATTNPESNISEDINAILIPCPKNSVNNTCEPHLIINIHMNPSVDLSNMEDSWILDEVYDPTKRSVLKIISPYLIVVGRGEPVVMYPLQYEESIQRQEFRREQPTKDDDKNPKGSPSSHSDEPLPSIKTKEREEVKDLNEQPTDDRVMDVQDSPTRNSTEPNPTTTMKGTEGKDVQGSPPDQKSEPRPSINMNESEDEQATEDDAKDVQDSPSLKSDEPRSLIHMKEREDEQSTADDAKSRQSIPSSKTDEPDPSIKIKESYDKDIQDSSSDKNNEPGFSITMKGVEDNKDVQGAPSDQNIEPHPSINMNEREDEQASKDDVKEVQDSPSVKTDEPRPSINMNDREGKNLAENDVKDGQCSLSSNSNEPIPSIITKESERDKFQGSPCGQNNQPSINMNEREDEQSTKDDFKDSQGLHSANTNDSPLRINIQEQEDVDKIQSSPSGETKEPLFSTNKEKYDEVVDIQGFPFGKTNDIDMKKHEYEQLNEVKSQDSPSRNESEITDASRLKRHHGVVYTSKQSVGFNIAFLQKAPDKDKTLNQQKPSQSDLSSLGLIEVRDPPLKKDRMESPKELHSVQNRIQKHNKNPDEKKNLLRSSQYFNQELDINDPHKINKIERDRKASGTWDKKLFDTNSKESFYQKERERDYHPKSESDSIREKDFLLFPQSELGDERKHISEEIKNFKPTFRKNLFSYRPKTFGSNSNENYLSSRVQSLKSFPHEKEENYNIKPYISRVNDYPHEIEAVRNKFKLPYSSLSDLDNVSDMRQNFRDDLKQPLNVPTDFNERKDEYYNDSDPPVEGVREYDINNEYSNVKTAENKYLKQGRVPEHEIKNEHYITKTLDNIINKENYIPLERGPELDRKNEYHHALTAEERAPKLDIKNKYYNAKLAENSANIEIGLPQRIVPEYNRKLEYNNAANSIYKGNDLSQGKVPEHDIKNDNYNAKTDENNICTVNALPEEIVPKHERKDEDYNDKTTENIINKVNNPPQIIISEHDKENKYFKAKIPDTSLNRENYLSQERVPEHDITNKFYISKTTESNIKNGKYLSQERFPEHDINSEYYNAKSAENNIYTGNNLAHGRVPEHDEINEYNNDVTAENDIYTGNDLEESVPDHDRINEYYNAKIPKSNINIENDLPHGVIPEHDQNKEYYSPKTTGNVNKGNGLQQERFPELERKNEYYKVMKTDNTNKASVLPKNIDNIYKGSVLAPEYYRKNKYYNAKIPENIFKGIDLSQQKGPEHDRMNEHNNDMTAENNIYTENDLKERVPEYDRKSKYYISKNNINIGNDLPQEIVPEHDQKNEYYNPKTTENIFKGNGLQQERFPELERKNEYYKVMITDNTNKASVLSKNIDNIYKGSVLAPEYYRKNKYYNAKIPENIFKGIDQSQQKGPEHDRMNEHNHDMTAENNIYSENDLTERVPEYDLKSKYYISKNNIDIGNDLRLEIVPGNDQKNEYYNPKTTEIIHKGNGLQQERFPELERKNEYYKVAKTENMNKGSVLPPDAVPEHDRKNKYFIAKITENIYKGIDPIQGAVTAHDIKNIYYNAKTAENTSRLNYPSSKKSMNFNFNEPMKSHSGIIDVFPYAKKYDQLNVNPHPSRFPNVYSLKQEDINFIINKHMRENLQKYNMYKNDKTFDGENAHTVPYNINPEDPEDLYFYKNGQQFDWKSSKSMPQNFNPRDLYSDRSQPFAYSRFPSKKLFPSYPRTNPYRSAPRNYKRIRRSYSPEHTLKDAVQYMNDPNSQKALNLEKIEENGEVPCDTCGGKNKKKDDKPQTRYCSALTEPKSLESKIESSDEQQKALNLEKIEENGEVPCDTCGGKNKKKDDKPPTRYCSALTEPKSHESKIESSDEQQKGFSFQKIEENGEVPCDTCGGKNKKKDDKPPTRYCSALTEPKSPECKMEGSDEQGKLNDVIPCDTCGGKNKKVGGKPLPGGLDSEIHRVKAETGQQIKAEDMIPCKKCKVDSEGNLASQSCGCVSNPSICQCEGSKLSRTPDQSNGNIQYGVFNMNDPIPYLTTQLRVFRRRHNTWWRIVPIVTVDSVSGIFANKNMSMIFSTRVGTLRQEKSARFVDHKLLIPLASDDQLAERSSLDTLTEMQNNIGKSFLIGSSRKDVSIREINNSEDDAVKGIDTLGYFPVSMKALQLCPHRGNNLCLNIRGERVPEFSIKVKIPFRENSFMVGNKQAVKISNIITDATTKDALHISIDVINKGLEAHEYSIYVYNCPLSKSALSTTSVRRHLLPDIGQTVTFLLPFINGAKKNKKFSCDVVVKESDLKNSNRSFFMKSVDTKSDIISKRPMDIKVHSRCFCIGRCRCHCMEKLETFINYKVCERMSRKAEEEAGLIYNCPPGCEGTDVCITDLSSDSHKQTSFNLFYHIQSVILIILIWLLFFGLLKAIFGLCIQSIDKWGFDTVQPGRYYACTSRIRIFIVNVFLFIIYPFACWCKCFKPRPEDLMAASTEWSCNHEMDDEDCTLSENKGSRLCGGAQKLSENLLLAFAPHYENGLFKDDKLDDEESTAFILEVLEESKTSLSKMMSQSTKSSESPEIVSKCAENSEEERSAEELVDSLKTSQRAYRTMSSPVGGVTDIPENYKYCVKGFFLPSIKGNYEFISYHPLVQYIGISKENEVIKLKKPNYLHTDDFSRKYANKLEVFKVGDLSVDCPPDIPCINITPLNDLENSFVKLSALLKETHD